MDRQELSKGEWTVRAAGDLRHVPESLRGRVFAARVPGCIHTDLMDAGVIPDPAVGMNEPLVQWVSETDWCYELTFEAEAALFVDHPHIDLCFECLDTIATVELNGIELGRSASEFMPWHFGAGLIAKPGRNHLRVMFTSPLRHVHEMAKKLGSRPHNGDEQAWAPYTMMRKCASNLGWDWGPRVATCGITGEVFMRGWRSQRAHWSTLSPDEVMTAILVHIGASVRSGDDAKRGLPQLRQEVPGWKHRALSGQAPQFLEIAESATRVVKGDFSANGPWNPAGYGSPTLISNEYTVSHEGTQYEPIRLTTGWRRVDHVEASLLRVNGRDVFCRGANWIPEGLWPRDRTPERIRERLMQAKAAGMNMIRVWGGGRYESDAFYDICDQLGLMVWQDFMFACGCYPEEEPLRSLVEAEARYQVARLSRHPCVVVWCGGNENHWAYESWGFKERLKAGQTWGKGYWQELLPRIVGELSPHTPYVPDSPWSPSYVEKGTSPNEASEGDRHTWDLFGEDFRKMVPRFCSEFGVQSPSCMETLREAGLAEPGPSEPDAPARVRPGPATASNDTTGVPRPSLAGASGSEASGSVVPAALLARQRGPGGMKRWYDEFFAKAGLTPPTTFEQWHAQAQQLQADWLYLAIVWLRANAPTCSGALIWQLNDAWPGFSWSLIDSAGREKPAYHAVKRAFADRVLERVPFDGVMHQVAINDTDEAWEAEPGWVISPRKVEKRRV